VNTPLPLSRGDIVQLEHDGARVAARVILISPNARSVLVTFEGLFAGHLTGMALLFDLEDGVYRAIADGAEITVTPGPLQ